MSRRYRLLLSPFVIPVSSDNHGTSQPIGEDLTWAPSQPIIVRVQTKPASFNLGPFNGARLGANDLIVSFSPADGTTLGYPSLISVLLKKSSARTLCLDFRIFLLILPDLWQSWHSRYVLMGISKNEVNLRRLLASAPQQQNQAKLVHYITTLREQLEQLGLEVTPEGLPSISKAKLNEYSEKIEALAARLTAPLVEHTDAVGEIKVEETSFRTEEVGYGSPPGLRRRFTAPVELEENAHEATDTGSANQVKLDTAAQAHIEKHRKLQEDLTDEMVVLARQLKESSLMMNQSLQDTEKILDSTERAVEHSLASTGRVNVRAMEVYSESFKTTCFTWLAIFAMTCIFIMVVLLIRVT
ncbi:putative vesicle transport protein, Use1 [Dioscorea sansibarensis]